MSSAMGHKSVEWAYGLTLPKSATPAMKSVLVAVAHVKNDKTGACYPGQVTLAEMTGQSVATVGRSLAALETLGVLSRERRKKTGKYRTSDSYVLNESYTAQSHIAESQVSESHLAARQLSPNNLSILTLQSDGVIEEQEVNRKKEQEVIPAIDLDALFAEAWNRWPKKVDRKDALAKFKIVARAKDPAWLVEQIIAHGDAHAAYTQRQFVRGLAVWLNKESWLNPLPRPDAPQRTTGKTTPTDRVAAILALVTETDQKAINS